MFLLQWKLDIYIVILLDPKKVCSYKKNHNNKHYYLKL